MESSNNLCSSTGAIPKLRFGNIQEEVEHHDTLTSKYLDALEQEIKNNEFEQDKLKDQIKKLQEMIIQLKNLAEQPEWPDSFIPVNPLAYIPGTIIHPGEHYVQLGPDTYSLMSLKETTDFLQRKVDYANKILDIFKEQQRQFEKRRQTLSFLSNSKPVDNEGMPTEIISDKGVAHKTAAGLYEVMETYNEEEEKEFYKGRQNQIKKPKQQQKMKDCTEKVDDFFERLDELQKQEDLKGELDENAEDELAQINNGKSVLERVKMILKCSTLYNKLSSDVIIREYCCENGNVLDMKNEDAATALCNESVLNKLIVESLINVSTTNYTDEVNDQFNFNSDKSDYDFHETISKNDLEASNFLDSIENNLKQWSL